jgi:Rrf2 family iron-sulfur cluster assembly transcriptional regulator
MRAISVELSMRLSTKGRYAVMAMTDLAAQDAAGAARGAVSLADIAARQQISLP